MAILSGGQVVTTTTGDLGERVPRVGGTQSWGPGQALPLLDAHATYSEVYRQQVWVATLVNKKARAQARLPLRAYRRGAGVREAIPDSPLQRLLSSPAPRMGSKFFWLWMASTREINGEAIAVKIRNPATGLPVAMWPMHPANVDVVRDDQGRIRYEYKFRTASGEKLSWGPEDVVHTRTYNPDTIHRGMSPLEPLRRSLLAEASVLAAQENWWRHGARPAVVLSTDKALTEPALKRLNASWNALNAGAASWGRTAVLEEGVKPHNLQLSPAEMQMIESRKISREEACAMYDVPPPVVHILDKATFSNITEQMRSMYRDTMAPPLGLDEEVILEQICAEFDDSTFARFLLDEVLRGDFEKRMESYTKGIYYGIYRPNEVRGWEDMEPVGPEGDQLYMSAAMLPMTAAAHAQPPARGSSGGASPKGLRAAVSRLGRVESLADVDLGVVTRGLDATTAELVAMHLQMAVTTGDDVPALRQTLAAEMKAAVPDEEVPRG